MKSIILGLLFACLALCTIPGQDELFFNFLKDYNKHYTGEEFEYRYSIFQENLKKKLNF